MQLGTKQGETEVLVHYRFLSVYYLQAVSMHVELCHWLAPDVNVLDLLGGYVLALGQLEDVLLPVDDFQRPVLHQDIWMTITNTDSMAFQCELRVLTGNHLPISPVWSQPFASSVSAVLSGSLR